MLKREKEKFPELKMKNSRPYKKKMNLEIKMKETGNTR